MSFFDINGWEFLLLIVIGIVVLGPERLPEYAQKLGKLVRQFRGYADAARSQLKEQMGPEFEDVDWSKYDIRQYDPRRIVREALMDNPEQAEADGEGSEQSQAAEEQSEPVAQAARPVRRDPDAPTPFDDDAT